MLRLNIKIGKKRIAWIYYQYSGKFDAAFILPWALRDYTLLPESASVDFMVLATWPYHYWISEETKQLKHHELFPKEFLDFTGMKFVLCGEPAARYHLVENCFQFVNSPHPDDPPRTRYGPTLGYWVPPLDVATKPYRCSVIDSGKRQLRVATIQELVAVIGEVHAFGQFVKQPLGGFHADDAQSIFGNSKHRGLADVAFHIAIESIQLKDYWTEKIGDAILCEAVPIYVGAPNIFDYFIPESLILREDVAKIDWTNWAAEYQRRRPYVLQQKEILRTKFNMFSYFDRLTDDLSLLDRTHPILR